MTNPKIQTAYAGEVLQALLVKATTGNEIASRGLARIEPNVQYKFYIPRLRAGKMLQKRKEQPTEEDAKGKFNIDERILEPKELMAFTTFNPRSFEKFWRHLQPSGPLVFRELPEIAQNALLAELAKVVNFELGDHFINGKHGSGENQYFDGILTRILADEDVIEVETGETTMIGKLNAAYRAIPKPMRSAPGLRFLVSIEDADAYDDELTSRDSKGANWTDTNAKRFKGVTIEALANWPQGVIVATITGTDLSTNLWIGVDAVNDTETVSIDRLTNAGELYFFKMLMKIDTQIAWGEQVVILDTRSDSHAAVIDANPKSLSFVAAGETKEIAVTVSGSYSAVASGEGFSCAKSGKTVHVTAALNTGAARTGKVTISQTTHVVEVELTQIGV